MGFWIRDQFKSGLYCTKFVSCSDAGIWIESPAGNSILIGRYVSKAEAIQVLDAIQKRLAWASPGVFQMPPPGFSESEARHD